MRIFARCCPLVDPLHLGGVDSSSHVDPVEQLIAHLLGPLFHGEGQLLHPDLDFASEVLACGLEPKVVFAMCISQLGRVALVEQPLVMECELIGGANIWCKVTWVLFLSLYFYSNIFQVLDFSLQFRIQKATPRGGRDYSLLWSDHFHIHVSHRL